MSEIAAAIAGFFAWLSTIVPAFVTPDWAALIGLLPLLVGITKRGAQLKIGAPLPTPAPLGADGRPHFPAGRPYAASEAAIYPNGSTRSLRGEPLLIACPSCLAVRVAERSTCDACGLELRARTLIAVERPAGPPPGGAARA